MDEKEIFEKIKNILIDRFDIAADKITMETDIVNDLGIDSFAAIELKFELEKKFNVKIDNSELQSLIIIKNGINYLKNKKGA